MDVARVDETIQRRALLYDKSGEEHYNLISALHKSMRNSDPDAAVYWLARMVEAGEDPMYIARRLVRFASEDIGNADPQALTVAVAAKDAVHFIGMPEGNTALAQAALYLATAPKSNAVYEAYSRAAEDAHHDVAEPVPLHLRNAPTRLMKELDYGKGYRYAHDEADAVADMSCLPPALEGRKYYEPKDRGFEKEIKRRLDGWEEIKKERKTELGSVRNRRSASDPESQLNLAKHLRTHRQDEREAVVALHASDGNADQIAALVEHAAARHAGMAVGQARDEAVRGPLADVTGRENDALGVVVAEPEDGVRELIAELRVHMKRRQVEIARADDGPVALVNLDVRVAGVDDLRRDLLALIHDLHRLNPPRARPVVFVAQRHHGVLDGDEVAVAQIPGGAVVRLALVVASNRARQSSIGDPSAASLAATPSRPAAAP